MRLRGWLLIVVAVLCSYQSARAESLPKPSANMAPLKQEPETSSERMPLKPAVIPSVTFDSAWNSRAVVEKYHLLRPNGKRAYAGPANRPRTPKGGSLSGDTHNDPLNIPAVPFFESGSTDGFNDDYSPACFFDADGSPDVVYRYVVPADQILDVQLCNSYYDTRLYIAYASDPLNPVACDDGGCDPWGSSYSRISSFQAYSGEELLIFVDGAWGDFGGYELYVSAPTGDNESDPIVIQSLPYTADASTDGLLNDYDEPCPDSSESPDMVFVFTPTYDLSATIDLCWSQYDTKVYVYENFIDPGFPYACNDDYGGCAISGFNSYIECLSMTSGNTYYIVVDGWGNQSGAFSLYIDECIVSCWTGCDPDAVDEPEPCDYAGPDTVNGGCTSGGMFIPIEPNQLICGTAQYDFGTLDTDWYTRYLFEGDTATWCVVANMPFEVAVKDMTGGCGGPFDAFAAGLGCDTLYVGVRAPYDGMFSFVVQPRIDLGYWDCYNWDPRYQAQLRVEPKCGWGFCPLSSFAESEPCSQTFPDNYNGGCYAEPDAFMELPDNAYICGQTWRTVDNWDEDAFLRSMNAGESVTFAVQAEFPVVAYIYDKALGCDNLQVVDYAEGQPCELTVLQGTASQATEFIFVVFAQDIGNVYTCAYGPWEYTAIINPARECTTFVCSPDAITEGESCEVTSMQGYNAGCNSTPPTFGSISYDEIICGTAWMGAAGYSIWRDTDWFYSLDVGYNDSLVWCVTAEFPFDAFIVDVSPDCDFDSNITVGNATGNACDTVYLAARVEDGQNLAFIVAPNFFGPWMWCEFGDWRWQASLTQVSSCACDCAHDPACDGLTDIFDVTQAVNVAFRNADPIVDSNAACPWAPTDVNCDGLTDIFDVTRLVNVAFRNGDPAVEFCDPCGPASE